MGPTLQFLPCGKAREARHLCGNAQLSFSADRLPGSWLSSQLTQPQDVATRPLHSSTPGPLQAGAYRQVLEHPAVLLVSSPNQG